jgi:hypothetical protein
MKNNYNILEGGGFLGFIPTMSISGIILIIIGLSLVKNYNKPIQKNYFEKMTKGQYIGIILIILGLIPLIQYFFFFKVLIILLIIFQIISNKKKYLYLIYF